MTKEDYYSERDNIKLDFYEHLLLREGVVDRVYKDSLGKLTVGVGHLLTPKEIEVYSVGDEWETGGLIRMFIKDADKAFNQAELQAGLLGHRWNPTLVVGLASVCFQLGNSWNRVHKKTWKYLSEGDFLGAAEEAERSKWFKQTPTRVRDFQYALRKVHEEIIDVAIYEGRELPLR